MSGIDLRINTGESSALLEPLMIGSDRKTSIAVNELITAHDDEDLNETKDLNDRLPCTDIIYRVPDMPILENDDCETGNPSTHSDCVNDNKKHTIEQRKIDAERIAGVYDMEAQIVNNGDIELHVSYSHERYRCCVCFGNITRELFSCDRNHPICGVCIVQLEGEYKCPICRSVNKRRNYLLEAVISSILIYCDNDGCTHKMFDSDLADHKKECMYTSIECPWCAKKTTPFDLQSHSETLCDLKFTGMECSGDMRFIKSEKVGNIVIKSSMHTGRTIYIVKTEEFYKILCIQDIIDVDEDYIMMRTKSEKKHRGSTVIAETRNINISICSLMDLINRDINICEVSVSGLSKCSSINITGIKETHMVGGRWLVEDRHGRWYKATITKRVYNPDMVLVKFDKWNLDRHDEWINLDCSSSRIKPMDGNLTSSEQHRLYLNMGDEELMRLVMERSMSID